MNFATIPYPIWLLIVLVLLSFIYQNYYYFATFYWVTAHKKSTEASLNKLPAISVILSAHNEYDHLKEHLPILLTQDYPQFEVVVINDCSSDKSDELLKELSTQYPNLVVRTLTPATVLVNSRAIALGIALKAAQYDKVVLTEAYTQPLSSNWLQSLASHAHQSVMSGYTQTRSKTYIRADRFFHSVRTLRALLSNAPYAANTENVVFDKQLFFNNKGFNALCSGQDKVEQIFFNNNMQSGETAVCLDNDVINSSNINYSFSEWRRDKRNSIKSERLFIRGKKAGLPELISRYLFFISTLLLILLSLHFPIILFSTIGLFLVRLVTQSIFFYKTQKQLGELGLLWGSLAWDYTAPWVYLFLWVR